MILRVVLLIVALVLLGMAVRYAINASRKLPEPPTEEEDADYTEE